jgi:quinolinate synthase
VDAADLSGSTAQIIRAIEAAESGSEWAIGTEVNLVKRLKQDHPDKFITLASPYETCAWCVDMARITVHNLADVLDALTEGRVINEVTVPDAVARDARLALERMLAIPK